MTLLLTRRLARVLFFFFAIIGLSTKICFRELSWSIDGQCMQRISLAASQRGPNLIGRTTGALLVLFLDEFITLSLLLNGYRWMISVISEALYPLSINFCFSCFVILLYVSAWELDRRYLCVSPFGMAV